MNNVRVLRKMIVVFILGILICLHRSEGFSPTPRKAHHQKTQNMDELLVETKCGGHRHFHIEEMPQNKGFTNDLSRLSPVTFTEEDLVEDSRMSRLSFLSKSSATIIAIVSVPTKANAASNHNDNGIGSKEKISALPLLTSNSDSTSSAIQEAISGFVSGAAITTTKTFVKYPLDTATVRLQMPNTSYSINSPANIQKLFQGSFRGITLPLLSNIPGGAIFFAIKDATKSIIKESDVGWIASMPKWLATCIAVGVAQPPYWLVRNPSEVIKTRQQANIEGYAISEDENQSISAIDAFRLALDTNSRNGTDIASGINGFYTGYWENIAYAYPADVIKFVAYEKFTERRPGGKKGLKPAEAAIYGALATAVAQFTTTPLDVVRNRVMATVQDKDNSDLDDRDTNDNRQQDSPSSYFGSFARLAREEGIQGLFAGATPRVGKAFLSGAIQFATYESVRESIANVITNKR
eukprot:74396_1